MNGEKCSEDILNVKQVAHLLGMSQAWVYEHARSAEPRLPVLKMGNFKRARLRFRKSDVEAFQSAMLR